jgi:alkaline phosphatase D
MKIITGPVVGHVCTQRVRILLEFDEVSQVTIQTALMGEYVHKVLVQTVPYCPVIAEFQNFQPGTYSYSVISKTGEVLAESMFTVPDPTKPIKLLVVSCNDLYSLKSSDTDMWAVMLQHHCTEGSMNVDMLLHIGDQIYEHTRKVWQRTFKYMTCIQAGQGTTHGSNLMNVDMTLGYLGEWQAEDRMYSMEEVKEIITELYRSLYRQAWNHPPLKEILSRVSNHMVLDDHDIRNGWGIIDFDRKPGTIEYTIGQCAHRAYQEYQAQLWRDLDADYHVDHRTLIHMKTAIFLMDVRNPRTFCYQDDAPYIGAEQMLAFQALLQCKDIDNLMVVCSIPLIMGSETHTNIAAHFDVTFDVKDSWDEGRHRPEHAKVLNLLREWKLSKPGRSLLLVGGDIHFALHSVITDIDGQFICSQVVTSPIATQPTKGIVGLIQDFFCGNQFVLYNQFHVEHTFQLHKRNYAEIQTSSEGWKYTFHTELETK